MLLYRQCSRCFLFSNPPGKSGECLNVKAHRSAPGGSGAGGSVVIITKSLHGNPNSKIQVDGGIPVDCAFGTGGGKLNPHPSPSITNAFSNTFSCVFMRSKTSVESS